MMKSYFVETFENAKLTKFFKNLIDFFLEINNQYYKWISYKKIFFSYLSCDHIWKNLFMDHCHFGYNTNLIKKEVCK